MDPRYGQLVDKVDAFFSRAQARHPGEIRCASGCSDCCEDGLTITGVEAAAIRAYLTALPTDARARLGARAAGGGGRCAALDEDGRCAIYPARPLVCRSHGLPIRLREGGLPVVRACAHNFTGGLPDDDCVLDQATLSTLLAAVDRACGGTPGERFAVRALVQGA